MCAKILLKISIVYVILTIAYAAIFHDSPDYHQQRDSIHFPVAQNIATNRLILRDCPIFYGENAVDDIRVLIGEIVKLPEMENSILQAAYTEQGILFEMSDEKEVMQILIRFSLVMRFNDCVLKSTRKDFIDLEIR